MGKFDNRVDVFINGAAPFAKPILEYVREVVHETSPLITETVKWGMPFFEYKGPICFIAAFKLHCGFGFWKASLLDDPKKILTNGDAGAGNFGKITTITDLPPKEIIEDFIKQAIARNEAGIKAPKKAPALRTELVVPQYFIDALAGHPQAQITFDHFTYSQQKDYLTWIDEAKTDATRQKRLETTVEWLTEGKTRHWKYK